MIAPYAANRTFRVVSVNADPRRHLIEAEATWKAKEIRRSGRRLLCGREIRGRGVADEIEPQMQICEEAAVPAKKRSSGDKIRVGGEGGAKWCEACLAASARGVIAP